MHNRICGVFGCLWLLLVASSLPAEDHFVVSPPTTQTFVVTTVAAPPAALCQALLLFGEACPHCDILRTEAIDLQTDGWQIGKNKHIEIVEKGNSSKYFDPTHGGIPQTVVLKEGRIIARWYGSFADKSKLAAWLNACGGWVSVAK